MKHIVGEFSTTVKLSGDEAINICKLGQKEKACVFLVAGPGGFECVRMALYPSFMNLVERFDRGETKAKGAGGWKGCAWEGQGWGKDKEGGK